MLLKRLPDGSRVKRRLPGWFESLIILQLCFCSVWGRCPAERGGQTQRCAQLSARLSAELCSPDLWRYCTTLRCTESIHFLWPLNRKFSGLLVRPWIPQLSQMVQSLPGFLDLCLNVCSPSQVLGDVYTKVLEAAHPLHRPQVHKARYKCSVNSEFEPEFVINSLARAPESVTHSANSQSHGTWRESAKRSAGLTSSRELAQFTFLLKIKRCRY